MLWLSSEALGNTAENVLYLKIAGCQFNPRMLGDTAESQLHLIMSRFLHAAPSHIHRLRVILTLGFPG